MCYFSNIVNIYTYNIRRLLTFSAVQTLIQHILSSTHIYCWFMSQYCPLFYYVWVDGHQFFPNDSVSLSPQVWWTPTANWTVRWCGIPPSPPPLRETLTSASTKATCSDSTASPRFTSPHWKWSCGRVFLKLEAPLSCVSIRSAGNQPTDAPSPSDPPRRH